jgi:hypothetical protein
MFFKNFKASFVVCEIPRPNGMDPEDFVKRQYENDLEFRKQVNEFEKKFGQGNKIFGDGKVRMFHQSDLNDPRTIKRFNDDKDEF